MEEKTEEPHASYSTTYEEEIKAAKKEFERILFSSITSTEMTQSEKKDIVSQMQSALEEHLDIDEQNRIMKSVIRKSYKKLLELSNNSEEIEQEFEDKKEMMKDRDYLVDDNDWEELIAHFEKFKRVRPPKIQFSMSAFESRTEEVDGIECAVANFAVKGLYFRSEEDQDAARTLKVGDPLTMEPEPDNPKDPNAIKVFMEDGHHIGYVDGKCAGYVKENLPNLVKFVASKITDDYIPYIYAEAFFKKE